MKLYTFKSLLLIFPLVIILQANAHGAKNVKVVLAVPKRFGINMTTRTMLGAVSALLVRPLLKKVLPLVVSKSVITENKIGKLRTVDCLTGLAASLLVAAAEYLYYRYYPVTEDDWDLLLLNNPQDVSSVGVLIENSIHAAEQEKLKPSQSKLDEQSIELYNLLLDVETNTVSLLK